MAEKKKKKSGELIVTDLVFPLDWNVPEKLEAKYATNMVVQRLENEYLISFFEVKPPILLGDPESILEKAKSIKSIQANCVAQIIIAAEKMPSFVTALQDNLKRTMKSAEVEEE